MKHALRLLPLLLLLALAGCDFIGRDDAGGNAGDEGPYLFPVRIDGRWGYINERGRITIEPQFWYADRFFDGRARANVDDKRGYINESGAYVGETNFNSARAFSEGLAAVRMDGQWGYVNRSGSVTISPRYQKVNAFSEGRAFVCTQEHRWVYVNTAGEIIEQEDTPELREVEDGEDQFSGGLALIKNREGSYGYIDRDANPVIPPQFTAARAFSDGLAAVKVSDRWGFIDRDKNFVINPRYIEAGHFREGLVPVRENTNTWGFANREGQMVIAPQFEEARSFHNGRAAAMLNGRWGYIGRDGNWITEPEFSEVEDFRQGVGRVLLVVGDDERFGYVDRDGKYLWYPSD